jgi:hypothetical protein
MQNTQSKWTEKHKWCKGISYRGNVCFSVHLDCVFCIVPSIWYIFASLVFFCPHRLCVLHCFLYMIYLCITCVFLSTWIVCIEGTMQNTQSGWTEEHKWCKGISYRGNNAKHTIWVDRKTQVMQQIVCFALFLLYDIPLHQVCFSVHPDCVFCIVPSIWYTFASLVFFCPHRLCVLHCFFYIVM